VIQAYRKLGVQLGEADAATLLLRIRGYVERTKRSPGPADLRRFLAELQTLTAHDAHTTA
jgi:hypothetical protein